LINPTKKQRDFASLLTTKNSFYSTFTKPQILYFP